MSITTFTRFIDCGIRIVLGVLFIVAGFLKLLDPEAFTVVIEAFGLVPDILLSPLSIGLPLLEVVAGLGLVFNVRPALHLMTLLLFVFMAILLYGMHLGLDIDCGCYGPEDPESRAFGGLRTAFFRDLFMAAGLLVLYVRRIHRYHTKQSVKETNP
jgi:uncharacterized membrane protein YphA (DoxX/SURF4 family)